MKYMGYLFAALLLSGSIGVLVTSCQKDYDGQIEILRNQIKNGDINLTNLQEKVTLIEQQITVLEEAMNSADDALKSQLEALRSELETTKSDLQSKIDELQTLINDNSDGLLDLKNELQAAIDDFNTQLSNLSGRIDGIDASLNVLDGRVTKLENQVKALEEERDAIQASIEGLKTEIDNLGADAEEQKTKLEGALETLGNLQTKLDTETANLQEQIDQLKKDLAAGTTGTNEKIENLADKIAELKAYVDTEIAKLNGEVGNLSTTISGLQDQIKDINAKYAEIDDKLKALEEKYDQKIADIYEKIAELEGNGDSSEDLKKLQDALETVTKDLEELKTTTIAGILKRQELFGKDLEEIEKTVTDHEARIKQLEEDLAGLIARVTDLEAQMDNLLNVVIPGIEDRLDALEKGGATSEEVQALKTQLSELKATVLEDQKKFAQLEGKQDEQAKLLADLSNYVTNQVLALNVNYNDLAAKYANLNAKVDVVYSLLYNQLDDIQKQIADNKKAIVDLQTKIEKLENGSGSGNCTCEDVEKWLENYYNKDEIDAKLEELYTQILAGTLTEDKVNELIAQAKKDIQSQLDTHAKDIEDLQKKYDELYAKVDTLDKQVQAMIEQYDAAIKDIQGRLTALENGGVPSADLSGIKQQLNQLQENINRYAKEIESLKGNQQQQAGKLTALEDLVTSTVIAMNQNYTDLCVKYNLLESQVGTLNGLYQDLYDRLSTLTDGLSEVRTQTLQNKQDIVDLQEKIKELENNAGGGSNTGLTKEDVDKMLEGYYNKEAIDQKFEEVYSKLGTLTEAEVNALIATAVEGIQQELDAYKQKVDALEQQYNQLNDKVNALIKRIQSMIIKEDYSDGSVKLTKVEGEDIYQMNIKVQINPTDAVSGLAELKSLITTPTNVVIPVRSGNSAPVFNVVSVTDEGNGVLNVLTECENLGLSPLEENQVMAFNVRVLFKNSTAEVKNECSTEEAGVRFFPTGDLDTDATYTFTDGDGSTIHTYATPTLSQFQTGEKKNYACLSQTGPYWQISESAAGNVFNGDPTAVSLESTKGTERSVVCKGIVATYNSEGTPVDLSDYVSINSKGALTASKSFDDFSLSDVRGYQLVIEIKAANEGGTAFYGKPAYMCVVLREK